MRRFHFLIITALFALFSACSGDDKGEDNSDKTEETKEIKPDSTTINNIESELDDAGEGLLDSLSLDSVSGGGMMDNSMGSGGSGNIEGGSGGGAQGMKPAQDKVIESPDEVEEVAPPAPPMKIQEEGVEEEDQKK